ncbi:MAG: hypothetical protein WBQ86_25340 [Candidatus Binatus sp.]
MQRRIYPQFIPLASLLFLGMASTFSAVTPQAYGAKGDGMTDDTRAFQSALKAGDLLVPPATYMINGDIEVPSYRHVQCQPGANLHTTRHDGNESGVITFNAVSYSSVVGCTITGSNTAAVPVLDSNQWNYLVWVKGSSHNIVINGNTLKNSWANSALHIDGNEGSPNIPSTDILVTYNNFESNAYYGLAIISANNVQVVLNHFVDSSVGSEVNKNTDQNTDNSYSYNSIRSVAGNHANCRHCSRGVFLTGGAAGPDTFSYRGNIVSDNVVEGSNTYIYKEWGGGSASYTDNRCINGCREQ